MTTTTQSANASANSNQNVFILPQITVQHDLSHVIDDVHDGVASNGWEDVWVSCYLEGRPSIHGKLRIARSNDGVSFEARDGVQWQGTSTAGFRVACPTLEIQPTPIHLPKHFYRPPDSHKNQKITAFDVAPDNSLFATGYGDGSIIISSSSTSTTSTSRKIGNPHRSIVLSLRFFPSSIVLLSSSSDHSLKIHDAKLVAPTSSTPNISELSTVRSLQAHSSGIPGCAIIERGKNVLSFSKDATVRLWNVSLGNEIVGRRWRAERGIPVLCGSVGEIAWTVQGSLEREGEGSLNGHAPLEGEVGTEKKAVFVGLQDGSVRGYELATGHPLFYSSPLLLASPAADGNITSRTSPIDSICYSPDRRTLAAGRRDGHILIWDLPSNNPNSDSSTEGVPDTPPTVIIRRNTAGIETLYVSTIFPTPSEYPIQLLTGSVDGLFCRLGIAPGIPPVLLEEFIGVEAGDSIKAIKAIRLEDGAEVIWCAADDGVRRY